MLIAGRQIATAEKLEVLALCTDAQFAGGLPLFETVALVRFAGGVPVIPWGMGKWLGRKGTILTQYLKTQSATNIFLGDNSSHPVFWRDPSHFKLARTLGIRILPGSDPLPFALEHWRPGSFGFIVRGKLSFKNPAQDIKQILLDPSTKPEPYGPLDRFYPFLRNQLTMQLKKHVLRTRLAG